MTLSRCWLCGLACWLVITGWVGMVRAQPQSAPPDLEAREERAFQEATALVASSLVRIDTVGSQTPVEGEAAPKGPTTGIIVESDGWIITSSFQFGSVPEQTLVTLSDGRKFTAKIVSRDELRSVTLLKIDAQDLFPARPAPLKEIRVGQWALALGRTLDPELPSLSVGVVSALQRIWGKAVQTDAKVSPINYGGALADVQGRVIGVLVPLSPQKQGGMAGVEWYDSGIGFAIPMEEILARLPVLKSGKTLKPGLLGISFDLRDELSGVPRITRVRYGSPAQKAGLKQGDLIVSAAGQKTNRSSQFRQVMGTRYAGDSLALEIRRGDQALPFELTLVDELIPYDQPLLGVLPERPDPTRPDLPGVKIRQILPNTPAARAKLLAGDEILQMNGQAIDTVGQLREQLAGIRAETAVTLQVRRGSAEPMSVMITAGSMTQAPQGEIPPVAIPAGPANAQGPKTGFYREKFGASGRDYWMYVPGQYHPDYEYGLVVWLHDNQGELQDVVRNAWREECEARGLILLAPVAGNQDGWVPTDADHVHELIADARQRYRIDPSRVVLHGRGTGGSLAALLISQQRTRYRGGIFLDTAVASPGDNEPDVPLQFFLLRTEQGIPEKLLELITKQLREMKFPVVAETTRASDAGYLTKETISELARWVDALDRL